MYLFRVTILTYATGKETTKSYKIDLTPITNSGMIEEELAYIKCILRAYSEIDRNEQMISSIEFIEW